MLFKRPLLLLALLALFAPPPAARASQGKPALEPLRILLTPAHAWSLQERDGTAYHTLLANARVHAVYADGSDVAWLSARLSQDRHTLVFEAADLRLTLLAQWVPPSVLPSTVTLLPTAFPKRPGVALRSLSVLEAASLPTLNGETAVLQSGTQSASPAQVRVLPPGDAAQSGWFTALRSGNRGFLAGYLSSVIGLNTLDTARGNGSLTIKDVSVYNRLPIENAEGTPLDALYLSWGRSPSDLLAQYAAAARIFSNVMDPAPNFQAQGVPHVWAGGSTPGDPFNEDQILANADAARRDYGARGLDVIELGGGYETVAGDWDANDRFPHGHRWLANEIHRRGFRAGLRLAPFAVSESSRVFHEHPEYLLRRADGSFVQQQAASRLQSGAYCLDASVPGARVWLEDLFRRITTEWGYDFVEVDLSSFPTTLDAVMTGPMTPVQAYRAALHSIRAGCGPKTYILAENAPIGPAIGLVNGMRVAPDAPDFWAGATDAARDAANRQWMHNVWWQNDFGPLASGNSFTPDQRRAWDAAVAISGGVVTLFGDLTALAPDRIAENRAALAANANGAAPAFGPRPAASARATGMCLADMWQVHAPPSVWRLPAAASPARITVAALFNWGEAARAATVSPSDLGAVPPGRRAHVWDSATMRYLGVTSGSLRFQLPPSSCRLIAMAPDTGHPQLLGTDAGLLAGAGDVLGVTWDAKTATLHGRSRAALNRPYRVAVAVPSGFRFTSVASSGAAAARAPLPAPAPGALLLRFVPAQETFTWTVRFQPPHGKK